MPPLRAPIARSCSRSSRSRPASASRQPDDASIPLPQEDGLVTIGRIVRPHGLRGAVVVRADASALTVLGRGLRVAVVGDCGAIAWTAVRHVTLKGDSAMVELEGTSDRDGAALLVGSTLGVERAALPPADGSEIYECDLIGIEVYSRTGTLLGSVVEILATGANDVWVVRGSGGELLVPAVGHAVLEVDTVRRRAIVDEDAAVASE